MTQKVKRDALGLPEGSQLERVKVLGEDWPPEGFGVGDPAQGPFDRSGRGAAVILSIELVGRRVIMETGGQPGEPTHVETYPVESCGARAKLPEAEIPDVDPVKPEDLDPVDNPPAIG